MKSTMKNVIANSGRKLFKIKRYKRFTILIGLGRRPLRRAVRKF